MCEAEERGEIATTSVGERICKSGLGSITALPNKSLKVLLLRRALKDQAKRRKQALMSYAAENNTFLNWMSTEGGRAHTRTHTRTHGQGGGRAAGGEVRAERTLASLAPSSSPEKSSEARHCFSRAGDFLTADF